MAKKIWAKQESSITTVQLRQDPHVLDQLHTNHMAIEKTKLLAQESVYLSSINADIENYIKHRATCLKFQQMQPKEKIIHHDIPPGHGKLSVQMYSILTVRTICVL